MNAKPRGRGNPVSESERERICELFRLLKNKKAVARAVNRVPGTIRFIVSPKKKQEPSAYFKWSDYQNSMI